MGNVTAAVQAVRQSWAGLRHRSPPWRVDAGYDRSLLDRCRHNVENAESCARACGLK